MRVVYILGTSRGGLPHYTAELANAVSNYAEVTVIKPRKTTADDIFSDKVEVIDAFKPLVLSYVDIYKMRTFSLDNLKNFLSYRNIELIEKINPDIVHFTCLPPQVYSLAWKLFRKKYPIVETIHSTLSNSRFVRVTIKAGIRNLLLTLSLIPIRFSILTLGPSVKVSQRIIVHAKEDKRNLVGRGVPSEKIVVIPHGVYDFFKKNYKSKQREEKNCILFFGNIVPVKAVDVLIDAVPIIVKEIPNVKVVIAGDGIIPSHSRKIIEKYKLNFEVHNRFIENKEVSEFFSRASLVAIPNRDKSGHSGVLTIAYSFGKPVVATNIGEFPTLVRDVGCGLVVPPDNPQALAKAIVELLKNDKLRKKLGKSALKKAEELSWDNIAKMHIKVYEEVLNERRGRS